MRQKGWWVTELHFVQLVVGASPEEGHSVAGVAAEEFVGAEAADEYLGGTGVVGVGAVEVPGALAGEVQDDGDVEVHVSDLLGESYEWCYFGIDQVDEGLLARLDVVHGLVDADQVEPDLGVQLAQLFVRGDGRHSIGGVLAEGHVQQIDAGATRQQLRNDVRRQRAVHSPRKQNRDPAPSLLLCVLPAEVALVAEHVVHQSEHTLLQLRVHLLFQVLHLLRDEVPALNYLLTTPFHPFEVDADHQVPRHLDVSFVHCLVILVEVLLPEVVVIDLFLDELFVWSLFGLLLVHIEGYGGEFEAVLSEAEEEGLLAEGVLGDVELGIGEVEVDDGVVAGDPAQEAADVLETGLVSEQLSQDPRVADEGVEHVAADLVDLAVEEQQVAAVLVGLLHGGAFVSPEVQQALVEVQLQAAVLHHLELLLRGAAVLQDFVDPLHRRLLDGLHALQQRLEGDRVRFIVLALHVVAVQVDRHL